MKISKSSPDLWTKLPEYTLIRRLTTHLYSTRACLILLQCYNASYFLCSLDKTVPPSLVSPIHTMFTNLVIQAVNLSLWNVTLSRHFHLLRLQLQYQNLVIQKYAWLIEVNKKREKLSMTSLAMLQCIDTWKPPMFSIKLCQCKDSWNFARFFGPEYSGSPRSTKIFRLFHFWQTGSSLPYFSSLMQRIRKKEYKLVRARLLLVSPVSSEFIFLGWSTPHVINTILRHYAHIWIFWREFFVARKKRLEARARRLAK